ncbi:O-antigen ligase family protein [Pseudoblastomonas halimionae]|nr:O-antigen ligase family protein [Alteriqipengyuania halimionae]
MLLSGGSLALPRLPLLLALLIFCFAHTNPIRMFRREFLPVWFVLLVTGGVALIGGGDVQVSAFAVRYANFLAAVALLAIYVDVRPGTIADELFPILRLMAVQAVLTPVLAFLRPDLFWSFNVGKAVYETFLYIFTYHDLIANATTFKRPDGFFFEAGVFQIYLNIFLFICLFMRRFSLVNIGLATLAVIATQSTTGAVILVMQYGIVWFRWIRTTGRWRLAVLLAGPILLVPIAAYATYNLGEKFHGQFSGSTEAREFDLRTGINVAMEKPLTGIGFDHEKYQAIAADVGYLDVSLSAKSISERTNSNGLVVLLYSVGIPLSLVFLWGIWRQRLWRPRWLFAMLILLSMTSEALVFSPFILMIAFSGLLIPPSRESTRSSNPEIVRKLHRKPTLTGRPGFSTTSSSRGQASSPARSHPGIRGPGRSR